MTTDASALLGRIEKYLDAVPRSSASVEQTGKFSLFRPRGPWPYYGRPRLGLAAQIAADDVAALRARQRELKLPQSIEWVVDTTPSLAEAAGAAGMSVSFYPLFVLARGAFIQPELPPGIHVRLVEPEDSDFARAHAVAVVGFGAGGTQQGPAGAAERDERAAGISAEVLSFMRDRAAARVSISAAAFDGDGPLALGTHQPVDAVSEIVGVATLPSARRRGLGAAVTAALVEDAWARGVDTVFLSAGSDDVARVYERIGFRRIGFAAAAEPSAPDDESVDVNA